MKVTQMTKRKSCRRRAAIQEACCSTAGRRNRKEMQREEAGRKCKKEKQEGNAERRNSKEMQKGEAEMRSGKET
jgi:hypothetical protein